jgi:RHS repeat-associated protein
MYSYNAIYSLVDFRRGMSLGGDIPWPTRSRSWQLDGVHNWTQFSIDGKTYSNSVNQMNEYDDWSIDGPAPVPDDDGLPDDFKVGTNSGFNHTHDKNGNLVNDGTKEYSYDYDHRPITQAARRAKNQLTLARDSQTQAVLGEYWYDALGRRTRKLVGGVSTVYIYTTDWQVIEEYNDHTLSATYAYGDYIDEVLTMTRGGQTYYYHQNAILSVIAVTDGSGDVVELYAYDPYGHPHIADRFGVPVTSDPMDTASSLIDNPYLFTGRRHDNEDNLYYYRSRYLDPTIGRFLTPDPIGIFGDPYNLGNAFSYAGNNPFSFTDSSGMLTVKVNVIPKYLHKKPKKGKKPKKHGHVPKFSGVTNPRPIPTITDDGCSTGCMRVNCTITVDLNVEIKWDTKRNLKHSIKHALQIRDKIQEDAPGQIDPSSWNEHFEQCLDEKDPKLRMWARKCRGLGDAIMRISRGIGKAHTNYLKRRCKKSQPPEEIEALEAREEEWPKGFPLPDELKPKPKPKPKKPKKLMWWEPGRGVVFTD